MWAEYWHLIQDPAHVLFEITYEAITALAFYPVFRLIAARWHKRHDEEVHGENICHHELNAEEDRLRKVDAFNESVRAIFHD